MIGCRGERGAGLVSLLGVVVALGLMAAVVVSSLPEGGLPTYTEDGTEPHSPPVSTGPATRPAGVVGSASIAACRADVASLERVVATYNAALGTYPAALSDLITAGFLSGLPELRGHDFTLEVAGGQATGRVLVNGRPGSEACNS